ncbi:MAG: hypothetical protein ABEJ28_00240 [Salinigranum sp.]
MNLRVDDTMTGVALGLGALVALAGLATLVGMPWRYQTGAAIAVGRILGGLFAIGIGAGVAWLATRT